MNIVALVKSAVDEAELRADAAGHPVLNGAVSKMSNFDKNGVEEAVKLKERSAGTITVLTLGGAESKKAIKEAMAMGATKAVHIVTDPEEAPDALETAYCLAQAIKNLGQIDIVYCSEGASDTYQGQVGAMVAELLGLPFLAFARKIEVDSGKVRCEQAVEGVVKVLEAPLPAVVSVVSEANVPRYPTLLQVIAAGKKQIDDVPIASLRGPDYPETGTHVVEVRAQAGSRKRVLLDGSAVEAATRLVGLLKQEGVL